MWASLIDLGDKGGHWLILHVLVVLVLVVVVDFKRTDRGRLLEGPLAKYCILALLFFLMV